MLSASPPRSICTDGTQRLAAKQPHRAVATDCDIDRVGGRDVADALRLLQAVNPVNSEFPCLEVDDADAVIAKLGDEQPLSREIDRQVIDAPLHVAERDFRFEAKRRIRRLLGRRGLCHCEQRKNDEYDFHLGPIQSFPAM